MAFDPARVKPLFLHASDLADPAERAAYLDRECGDDAELRGRVEALLAADGPSGPDPGTEASSVVDPSPAGPPEATRVAASEIVAGSPVPGPDAGLATLGATGIHAPDATLAEAPPAGPPIAFVPGRVVAGRYTLLEVLGEGGMGTVYLAEQSQPVRRQVALKLIRAGMDSRTVLARFDAERQALAMMDHPNIARVYDGGATDSNQPFFVMELVNGVAITDYCDRKRLSVEARLELFVAVCRAVQHAHQKGVIHRDLKPGNVLVAEVNGRPTPKVIDFGVAKATGSDLTDRSLGDTGAIVGTPTYMSPEQADPSSMDIDTRTDVYALGVILYELLAGSPPLDATQFRRGALLEMLRMVREVDPSKPSTKVSTAEGLPDIAANRGIEPERLKRALSGDLDWIVMKALEKDRSRRYETANGLGADILRHLASEPVLAAPPSRSYRLRKFARKHRAGVIAAGLVLLALVAGVTGTTWGLFEARRQEDLANNRAERERVATRKALVAAEGERQAKQKALEAAEEERKAKESAEAVLGFVENKVFAAARPKDQAGGLGFDVTLADAVQAALPSIEGGFPDKPLVEARLRRTIGRSFGFLGKNDIAAGQFEAARSLYSRHLGPDHPETLRSASDLASSYADLGRLAEALGLREETLTLQKARLGGDHPDTLTSMNNLASSYHALARFADALGLREEVLALRKARLGGDHPDTLSSMIALASSYSKLGRHAEALGLREEALALQKSRLGADHPDTLKSMNALANSHYALGRNADALGLYQETLALTKAKLGPDHPETLTRMNNLALGYFALGRHTDALGLFEKALAVRKTKLGPEHPETLTSMNNLAGCYYTLGRHAEALRLRKDTLSIRKAKLGPDHPDTLLSMNNLASSYLATGRTAEALPLLAEVSAANPKAADVSMKLAALQAWLGQEEEFAATRKRILAQARGTDDVLMANQSAKASSIRPPADRAEIDATVALARRAVELGKGDSSPGNFLMALGMAEYRAGEDVAADEALLAAAKAGPGHPNVTGISAFYRAMCLSRLGRTDEARKLAIAAAADMKPLPADERNPMAGGANADDLILWLAYKEAKATIGFNAPAPPSAVERIEKELAQRKAQLGPDHPDTFKSMKDLANALIVAGRTPEALPLLETSSAANPKDMFLLMRVAALQAWFGKDEAFPTTRRRALAGAEGTGDPHTAERVAKVCSLLPSADRAELDAAIALGRRAVDLGKDNAYLDFFLMTRGMAEYRGGHLEEAETSLAAAIDRPHVNARFQDIVVGTSAFYRSMSLFRRGKKDEARALATEAAARMNLPPGDERNPLAGGADQDDLILWLAYKEAKALIGFDSPPAAPATPDRK